MNNFFQAVDAGSCQAANDEWYNKIAAWEQEAKEVASCVYANEDMSNLSRTISEIDNRYRPQLSGSAILWPVEVQNAFKEDFFNSWTASFIQNIDSIIQNSASTGFWQFKVPGRTSSDGEKICEFLLQVGIMLHYHPNSRVYQTLWELFYNNPDTLERVALNIFSPRKLTWAPSEMGDTNVKGLHCHPRFPYLPDATPSTLSYVTHLRNYFQYWMSLNFHNKFLGKFILLDMQFAQFGLIFVVAMSGFRAVENHFLEFRETVTPQVQSDLTPKAPTDLGSRDLVASTMVEFRHKIAGAGQHPLPALLGFKRTMLAWEENYLDGIGNDIDKFLDQCPDSPLVDNLAQELEVDSFPLRSDPIKLVFGVSGIGKTKHLESLLSRKWGFYFMAGNLDSSGTRTERNPHDLYGAHRNGHSLDLHWLWRLVTSYSDMAYSESLCPETLFRWTLLLLYSRFLVLWVFRKKAELKGKDHPANWFLFQKSGDRFSALFWFLLVRSAEEVEAKEFIQKTVDEYGYNFESYVERSDDLYICLDEAQCDLEATIHITPLVDEKPTQSTLLVWVLSSFRYLSVIFGYHRAIILSGTSLRLADVRSAISSIDPKAFRHYLSFTNNFSAYYSNREASSAIYCHFPLLENDDQLRNLLYQDGFFEKFGMNVTAKDFLFQLGRPLRGRYLWSKLYIQQLNEQCSKIGATEMLGAIELAAKFAREIAVSHLKARLNQLKISGKHQLLQKICQLALDSHVFDRQTVFDDDNDHGIVTQGFAQVKIIGGQLKGCFAEFIAVETAMEWLVQEHTSLKIFLSQLLSNSSIHHTNFGYMAEWYLAFQLWTCLQVDANPNAGIIGSNLETRRLALGSTFKEARLLNHNAHSPFIEQHAFIQIPSDTFLAKGTKVASGHDSMDPQDWLAGMRDSLSTGQTEPRSSFYLPDVNAGPDLVFVLVSASEGLNFVCSVQLKTGPLSDGEFDDAFKKTSIYHSYLKMSKEKGVRVRELLDTWKNTTFLRVLICTSNDGDLPSRFYGAERLSGRTKPKPYQGPSEYFLYCNRTKTSELFGELFARVAAVLKSPDSEK